MDDTIDQFVNDCHDSNIFSQDEYKEATDLKDAIQARDFQEAVKICRRPLFSYIEIEIVKPLKKMVAKPPAHL